MSFVRANPMRLLLPAALCSAAMATEPGRSFFDVPGDARIRRTDPGANGILPPDHVPDLVRVRAAAWSPANPATDPWTGVEDDSNPHIFRVDIVFAGLVNPSGPLGFDGEPFDSTAFGPRPVIGFLDIDVDGEKDTGGELGGAATLRFLANAARFGGRPAGSLGERAAMSGADLDLDFVTVPQYERSGADFSIVLCGCETPTIVDRSCGDDDDVFEPGEVWIVRSRFFERAQGYQDASWVFGGSDFGLYDPYVNLRFEHSIGAHETTVSLVFALDHAGAAALAGQPQQAVDSNVSNHVSIVEGVLDLIDAAAGSLPEPVRTLTRRWSGRDPEDATDPTNWEVTAIFGTPYALEDETPYAWTDVGFEVLAGDFDGDSAVSGLDESAFFDFLTAHDALDGNLDGRYLIPGFGPNFSIFDVNGDGIVDASDFGGSGCRADLTGSSDPNDPSYGVPNGVADASDLFFYLDRFTEGDLSSADFTGSSDPFDPTYGAPDGVLDASDFFYYLDLFSQGCS